jgi:hypothetical protein
MKIKILFLLIFIFAFVNISAQCNSSQVDINSASAKQLDGIIHVGPATAQKIIDARQFNSLDELVNISGISEGYLEDIKQQGLACISDGNDIVVENVSQSVSTSQTGIINDSNFSESSSETPIPSTKLGNSNVIYLNSPSSQQNAIQANSKDINSENGALISGKIAIFGLFGFAAVILLLFGVKRFRKVKYRTEFD